MMISHTIIKTVKEPITFLEGVFEKIIPILQTLNKAVSVTEIEDVDNFIGSLDITEIVCEAKAFLGSKKILVLDIKLRKPYNDLNKFYQDYRRVTENMKEEKISYREADKSELKKLPSFSQGQMS